MATLKFWNAGTSQWEYVPQAGNASYSGMVPSGSTTAIINHGLGTTAVAPQCFRTSTGELVLPTFTVLDPNRIQLTFAVAPTAGEYRILVISAIPNESPIGSPVLVDGFESSRGTGALDAGTTDHTDVQLVIPNPGQYVELLTNMGGRIALGPAVGGVEVFANLAVSFDGGTTWQTTTASSATPSGTGDEEGGAFGATKVFKGTPTGDIIVKAQSNRSAGATSGTVNIYVNASVAMFRGENVVLDNRYMISGGQTPRSGDALFDEYPEGITSFAYTNDPTWHYLYGTVLTVLHTDESDARRGFQINVTGFDAQPEFAVRRWVDGSNDWSSWVANGTGLENDAILPTTKPSGIPVGISICRTESGQAWAEGTNPGTLETINPNKSDTGSYARQTWSCMAHDPVHVFARRWMTGPEAWSGWTAAF